MLYKRIINIALVLVLLLAVIGVSSSNKYCIAIQKVVSEDCCKDVPDKEQSCCVDLEFYQRIEADLSINNASVFVPDVLSFNVNIQNFILPEAALIEYHSYVTYSSPFITRDLSVLNQVFRI